MFLCFNEMKNSFDGCLTQVKTTLEEVFEDILGGHDSYQVKVGKGACPSLDVPLGKKQTVTGDIVRF